jgi:hypothetical protein
MPKDPKRFVLWAYGELIKDAYRFANRPAVIQSKFLRKRMKIVIRKELLEFTLFLDPYWAVHVHDGTNTRFPRTATHLIWFKRGYKDPRFRGEFPIRRRDVRKLTKAEYRRYRDRGVINVKLSAPGNRPDPFFREGMVPFQQRIQRKLALLVARYQRRYIIPKLEELGKKLNEASQIELIVTARAGQR